MAWRGCGRHSHGHQQGHANRRARPACLFMACTLSMESWCSCPGPWIVLPIPIGVADAEFLHIKANIHIICKNGFSRGLLQRPRYAFSDIMVPWIFPVLGPAWRKRLRSRHAMKPGMVRSFLQRYAFSSIDGIRKQEKTPRKKNLQRPGMPRHEAQGEALPRPPGRKPRQRLTRRCDDP